MAMHRWTTWILPGLLSGVLLTACTTTPGPGSDAITGTDGGPTGDSPNVGDVGFPDGTPIGACGPDTDHDGIPDSIEGNAVTNPNGIPNYMNPDSDGDGRTDGLEANQGRAYDCHRAPVDSDSDGLPDYVDLDSDNNGLTDAVEFIGTGTAPDGGWPANATDFNHNGVPDYCDLDDDGDRIGDAIEMAPGGPTAPTDTNHDGVPDYHDLDSDSDTIADKDEGARDDDGDMIPNYRDTDSDNDTILDSVEAGDMVLSTPPVECPRELNAATLMGYLNDGLEDYRDTDSDNDGLSDHEEMTFGTDRCNPDTDGDGFLDSAEVAWCEQHHRTGCATDATVVIPSTDYYLVLPYNGPQVNRELEFGTSIRVADVFFIFDTTGSMAAVQQQVAQTIATPTTGMIDSIRAIIPDTYFGVGHHDDFPTGGHGSGVDLPIHPLCAAGVGSGTSPECSHGTYGGIIETPPAMEMDVQTGALAIPGGNGDDEPEAQVEALYQIPTNDGLYDHTNPRACSGGLGVPGCWVRPTACGEGTWGYPCFRNGSLAIAVLFTDAPWHNGAIDISPPASTYFDPYTDITSPSPHNFDDMVAAYLMHSARQIMVNANTGARCEGHVFQNHGSAFGGSVGPCFDMRMSAEGTGSVDLDGTPLVYDLPVTGGVSTDFVSVVSGAINTLATRVPLDITTTRRNDATNPASIDATQFIVRRVPSCQIPPANSSCWTETAGTGITHTQAVARTDLSTFYRVVPGTRVRFTIFFQNAGVYAGSATGITIFHAFIDVVGDGATVLDTRDVFILVPAAQPNIG